MDEGMNADNLLPFKELIDSTYNRIYEFWIGYQKVHPYRIGSKRMKQTH